MKNILKGLVKLKCYSFVLEFGLLFISGFAGLLPVIFVFFGITR